MTPETEAVGSSLTGDSDIVAAVDEIDGHDHLVIADISRDDVWLSMAEGDTASLDAWR